MAPDAALRRGSERSAPDTDVPARVDAAFGVDAVFAYLRAHLPLLQACAPGERAADKAACEIALLCWGVSRNAAAWARLRTPAEPMLAWADARLRGASVLDAMLWQPARLPMLALGDGFLTALGHPSPTFRAAADAVRGGGLGRDCERGPYQALEVAFGDALQGLDAPSPPTHWLARTPFLPLLAADDGYAFTHALFYLTRFGGEPLPAPYAAADVHDALEGGLWWCLWRRDLDLLAEMLLCALYTAMPVTAAVQAGVAVLRACGRRDGHLSAWESLPAPRDATARFFQRYHPLLVAALLDSELALRATPLAAPPRTLATTGTARDATATLGIAASRERLAAIGAERFDAAFAACYGAGLVAALPQPADEDWRIVLGFVRRDAWTVTAGVAAQLESGRDTACARHARRWLGTLAPVVAARNA